MYVYNNVVFDAHIGIQYIHCDAVFLADMVQPHGVLVYLFCCGLKRTGVCWVIASYLPL